MKKDLKIVRAAKWAKENGYDYISSVVKSHFSTTYYHIVSVDDIIKSGNWIPAPKVNFASGARGRQGRNNVPEKTISRTIVLSKV